MTTLLKILIVILAGYGGFKLMEPYLPSQSPALPASAPENTPTVKSPSQTRVQCNSCDGRGKLVDESGTVKIGYTCPLCNGSGSKTLPANAKACTYCKGLGNVAKTPNPPSKRLMAQRCPICGGSGVSN